MLISAAKESTYAYDITESLTTEIGPRVGGSPEEALAREWAVKKFKEINAPEGGLDGKIVFISGRMKKAPDGAGYGPANQKRRQGATEAAKRGAIAVVIRSVGTDSRRFPHTGMMRYADDVKKIPMYYGGRGSGHYRKRFKAETDITCRSLWRGRGRITRRICLRQCA